jgi:hypothetical protein
MLILALRERSIFEKIYREKRSMNICYKKLVMRELLILVAGTVSFSSSTA